MASELRVNTLKDASGNNSVGMSTVAQGSVKAWVNYTHTSSTAARDSFNISSLTDAATGQANPISFTNNMSNNDYSGSHFANATGAGDAYSNFANHYAGGFGTFTTSAFGSAAYDGDSYEDGQQNCNTIIGDLA